MATDRNAPYKVLQRIAKAQKKSPGYPFWISCRLEHNALTNQWIKVPVQGTYRRGK